MFKTKKKLLKEQIGDLSQRLMYAGKDIEFYRGQAKKYASIADEWRDKFTAASNRELRLKEENEALKNQLEFLRNNRFYCSDQWKYMAELQCCRQANLVLKEKVVRLQKKLDEIGEIVED